MSGGRRPMTGSPTRRRVLRLACGMLLAASAASAQEPGRVYRLGGLRNSPRAALHWIAFFDELELPR